MSKTILTIAFALLSVGGLAWVVLDVSKPGRPLRKAVVPGRGEPPTEPPPKYTPLTDWLDEFKEKEAAAAIPVDDPRAVRFDILQGDRWTMAYSIQPVGSAKGPPCHCGHIRAAHEIPGEAWDGPCLVVGCACTAAGYQPAKKWKTIDD